MILDKSNPEAVEKYDNFVKNSSHAIYTQDRAWSKVKNNWTPEYVYLEDESGNIRAALSIIMVEAVPGSMFMYAPKGPVCDFYDIETVKELIEVAKPVAEKYNAFLLRMDPEVFEDEELVNKYRDLGYTFRSTETELRKFTQPRYNMVLDLARQEFDDVIELFNSNTRNKVRKSYRKGCSTRFVTGAEASDEEIRLFEELTEEMADRQEIGHRQFPYFKRLLKAYPDSRLYFISNSRQTIAGSICIPYGDKVMYLYAASSNSLRNVYSSEQMIYEEVKWTDELGKRFFDFGGVFETTSEDGLYRFKKGFTGEEGLFQYIGELDVVYDEAKYQEYLNK